MQTPLVTAAIITYNHERYIEQAVQSVLNQRVNFPVEILVADDCSTDRTPEVLRRLEQQYPNRMRFLSRPKNLGLSDNLQDCREQACGKYLAILEGDDLWSDPEKLQKQADAMEAHPDWTMCYGSCRVFFEDGSKADFIKPNPPPRGTLSVADFLKENQVQTMSVGMYRQGVITRTPEWHRKLRIGDWALHILHANAGPIGFIPDVLTSYRVHRKGLWSGLDTYRQWDEMLVLFRYLQGHFSGEVQSQMKQAHDQLMQQFSDRVKDLEKVERRYLGLKLDRAAACCRWVIQRFRSPQ
jgi:glycosyltransferase involved in cell wall biosynthesis